MYIYFMYYTEKIMFLTLQNVEIYQIMIPQCPAGQCLIAQYNSTTLNLQFYMSVTCLAENNHLVFVLIFLSTSYIKTVYTIMLYCCVYCNIYTYIMLILKCHIFINSKFIFKKVSCQKTSYFFVNKKSFLQFSITINANFLSYKNTNFTLT